MNAISPASSLQQATEPPQTDLEILQRLIVLSTQLAELASRQAHEEAASRPPEQAGKEPPRPRRADPYVIFLRLRRAIQETIAFRNRIAAGMMIEAERARRQSAPRPNPERATTEAPKPPEDPRRANIARYFREGIDITQKRRKIPLTQQDIDLHIDAELAKDPNHRLQGRDVLLKICKSLDLPFYANRMHPDLLRPPRPAS